MVRKVLYIFYFIVTAMTVCGCSKEDLGNADTLPYITFGVSGVDIDTKGLITDNDLNSDSHPQIKVYGVQDNTTIIFDGTTINKQSGTSNWETSSYYRQYWQSGKSYSIHGYTYSPSSPQNGASISLSNNTGLKITVSQPTSYSENNMIDYMLSHAYKVADGKNYRTVMLHMQHAMAWVEIEVWKEQENHDVKLTEIKLSNIYRSAVMQCDFQAIAGSGEKNVWSVQLSGRNDQVYSVGPFAKPADGVTKLGYMRVMAIPQQITNNTSLFVEYTVTEPSGEKTYEQTFYLKDYVPYVWESGHKIKYTLNINTGVHLEASIADWKEGGYTEGIILPQ